MNAPRPTEETGAPEQPLLRVVRGDASAEEVAALVAVLAAARPDDSGSARPARPTSEWVAQHRTVRRPLPHGPGGWRSSSLPR